MSTWVLLRGLTRGSGHWGDFADVLAARLSDARIVLLDVPGNGALHASTSPTRIDAMLAACRAQLASRHLAPPYHLLAVSMGAMVAIEWAARAPHELAGGVLINTSVRGVSAWHRRLRPGAVVGLLRAALLPASDRAREATLLRLTSCNPRAAEAVLDAWAALRTTQPVSRSNALRQLLAAARYRVPDAVPGVPLLLLGSGGDALVDPDCSRALARRWGGAHAEHPWAGHDLTLDDGPWVAAQIAHWRARRGGMLAP